MTERDIQKVLWRKFDSHKYRMLNVYFFQNESDWISWYNSGYCLDVEIKVSRSDYFNDFKKPRHGYIANVLGGVNHQIIHTWDYTTYRKNIEDVIYPELLTTAHTHIRYDRFQKKYVPNGTSIREHTRTTIDFNSKPFEKMVANRFCFAVPEGLITVDEVPEYAGLIYVTESGGCKYVKKPPLIHKEKIHPKEKFDTIYHAYENVLRRKLFQ